MTDQTKIRRGLVEPLSIALVIIALVISGVIALRNFRELQENRLLVRHTNQVLASLRETVAAVMDAESRQRGFLITGDTTYLTPFDEAVRQANESLDKLRSLTSDNPRQAVEVPLLRALVQERINELRHVLRVRAEEGSQAAEGAIAADAGNKTMDRIRAKADWMREIESEVLFIREDFAARSYLSGRTNIITSTAIGLILVGSVLYLLERNRRKAERSASQLRIIRERLELALDAGGMGSWNIDPETETLISDQRFQSIFTGQIGEITYEEAFDHIHPDDRAAVQAAVAASTNAVHPAPYSTEYRIVQSDGTVRWVRAEGAASFSGTGKHRKLSSFDGTVTDITDRKRQEQRLLESEQAANAANQSKSEFLANMSHEIRTPMAAILGYADVLLGHLKNPDNRNCVLVMKRNGQHLLELINDILDLSRIEAGKLDIDLESVSLPQLIADVQSLMHVRAEEKKLEFRAEFNTKVPEQIHTDPTRLRQVLINLIGNAIKFTDEGSVVLSVGSRGDRALQISVRDTGIGMSDEQQERLFKPFSQGDTSVTRSYGGSGLGLAISKRLVGMLGGAIEMESKIDVGSTFTVTLPIEVDAQVQWVQPDLISRRSEIDDAPTRKRKLTCRVLVVDDRRDVRHISQHFLEKAGATVSTAEDGQQGMDKAIEARGAEQPFDLIVMDMQMPNVDGLQATAQLRSEGIEWPIIALTADAMKGDRDRCLDGGCDDYLSKPIDHEKLVDMVGRYTQDISPEQLRDQRKRRMSTLRSNLGDTTVE
ncbi:Sensory/regulatory protein RpfC [Rubripirellula lacrimiformis]|uniref:histidine kinase n=2 Tax=Rubripirellula lacrimiformis TaxID=1930273 RepID=A0A517NJQ1_9BACT|nr:Sensory/regulatory protein RpfC [Rubripirellula lacrimiformis]